jgi:Helix-turn-helix domain
MEVFDGLMLDRNEVVFLAGMLRTATSRMNATWSPQSELIIARICDAATRFTSQKCPTDVPNQHGSTESTPLLPRDLVDSTEAGAILGISGHGARALARRGVLPAYRAGGRWLFPANEVVRRAERRAS